MLYSESVYITVHISVPKVKMLFKAYIRLLSWTYIHLWMNFFHRQSWENRKDPKRNRGPEGEGRACRHRAATSHMQEVTSQDSAEDLVGAAPAQEESGHKHMQEDQRQQDQGAPVRVSRLGYLPPLGQGLLQVCHFGLAAAELRLQLLTCLAEKGLVIRWEHERSSTKEAQAESERNMQPQRKGGEGSLNLPARCAAVSLNCHDDTLREVHKPWPPAQHPESLQSAPGGGRRLAAEPGTPWSTDGNAALTPRGKQSAKTKSKRTSKDIKTQSSVVCVSLPLSL